MWLQKSFLPSSVYNDLENSRPRATRGTFGVVRGGVVGGCGMRRGGVECAGATCQASHPQACQVCQVCQVPGVPGVPGVPAMRAILPSVLSVSDALNALQLLSCATAWLQIQCPQPIPQPILQQILMSYDCFDAVASLLYFQQPNGCGFSLVYIYIYSNAPSIPPRHMQLNVLHVCVLHNILGLVDLMHIYSRVSTIANCIKHMSN